MGEKKDTSARGRPQLPNAHRNRAQMPKNGDAGNRSGSGATNDGCIYPDDVIMGVGVAFNVRYTGCVEVKTSMKSLDFETRTQLAR